MKKVSTVGAKQSKDFREQRLTIGLDLGNRSSWYCVLDSAGEVPAGTEVGHDSEGQRQRTGVTALHWVDGEGVEVVRARSVADLRPLRMTDEFGEAPAQCNGSFVGPAFLVESFASHPFRKERGKDGAPPAARRVRMSARLESGKPQNF